MSQERLGKGLAALITTQQVDNSTNAYVPAFDITKILPNPYQPRMHINPEELVELADSIREHGIIQPLIITKDSNSDKYFLVAGERRFRASQLANISQVPVVIKDVSGQEMLELALIENIQRKDLNPLEEAYAFKQFQDEFGLTHDDISKKVGISRVAVTNKIRLLALPEEVRELILNETLSEGHARALLGLIDVKSLIPLANIIVRRSLSVRQTEEMVRKLNAGVRPGLPREEALKKYTEEMGKRISTKLGYCASITKMIKGGKITIRYNTNQELEDIVKRFETMSTK